MVTLHFDCLMAGRIADGSWIAHQPVDLYVLNRNLVFWIQQRHHCVLQWQHVYGHSGDPMNEAADCVAWAALNQWIPAPSFEEVIKFVTLDHTMSEDWHWIWLVEAACQMHPALPRLRGTNLVFDVSTPLEAALNTGPPELIPMCRPHRIQAPPTSLLSLRFVTANVLTLYAPEQSAGAYVSARMEALMKAFDDAHCDVIGLQETRSRVHGLLDSDLYHVLSSPADEQGRGGLQLWIRKRLRCQADLVDIASQDLHISHESDGLMIVTVNAPKLSLHLIVAHAPNLVHGEQTATWWRTFTSKICLLQTSPRVIMIDANARVGSEESDAIGGLDPELQTASGTAMHEFLESTVMMAPQTFEQYHRGTSFTWQHPRGSTARLDYLLVDQSICNDATSTQVSSVDLSIHRIDHYAVEGVFQVPLRQQAPLPLHVEKRPARPSADPGTPPLIPWARDVHTHATQLQGWLHAATPPKQQQGPRKKHLTDATWNLIKAKNYHYRRLRQVRATQDQCVLRACFQAWRASSHEDDAEQTIHEVCAGYQTFVQQCLDKQITLSEPTSSSSSSPTCMHSCSTCGAGFGSVQALSAHRWRAHGQRSVERQYMSGTTCPICGLCLRTTQRLQQHLKRSQSVPGGCFERLCQHHDPVPEGDRLRLNEIPDHLSHVDRLPAVRAEGPLAPSRNTVWQRDHAQQVQQWNSEWTREGYPETLDPTIATSCSRTFTEVTTMWIDQPHLHDLSDLWLQSLAQDDTDEGMTLWAFCRWGQTQMYDLLETLDNPDVIETVEQKFVDFVACFPMWSLLSRWEVLEHAVEPTPTFQPPERTPDTRALQVREPMPEAFACPATFLDPFASRRIVHVPEWPGIPLVQDDHGGLHLYILHLYSGRRRDGDCHSWLSSVAAVHLPHLQVHMLAVDTAIDAQRCNLMGDKFSLILRLCRAGVFGLILSGPPCETWSSARHLECRPGGPRPLRSRERLWGLRNLSTAELRQLSTGSSLMVRGLLLELAALLSGGAAVMEHPMIPKDPTYATVWGTSFHLNFLMALPHARACAFEQWRYGATCIKPTLLRSAGLPAFAASFLAHGEHPSQPRPTALLGGFDWMTKQYRTAAAKEYPSHMCYSLLDAALQAVAHRLRQASPGVTFFHQLTSDERQWLSDVELASSTVYANSFRADYQPTSL
eukprot:Skav224028  [mRNA]  locus=scaffold3968:96931:102553:+ [translate_table: standard]